MEPRSPCHARMFYIFQMSDRPALAAETWRWGKRCARVARDILAEARAAIEDPAKSEARGGARLPPGDEALARLAAAASTLPGAGRHGGCATRRAIWREALAGARGRPVRARCPRRSRRAWAGALPALDREALRRPHRRPSAGRRSTIARSAEMRRASAARARRRRIDAIGAHGRVHATDLRRTSPISSRASIATARRAAAARHWPPADGEDLHELRKRVVDPPLPDGHRRAAVAALRPGCGVGETQRQRFRFRLAL